MSEPLHARWDGDKEPRPGLVLNEQVTGRGRRRALHVVTDARPAPEPGKTTPRTPGKPARQLTDDEIFYFVAKDPGMFFEEDFYRDLQFDRAIDREPEIEW